ncbi:MAG TPA: zinc-dependent alcohol dehydrogenase family protein, partial [Longilinea sp.]|nr:zinc-dependent alcohol dehydrogenase family protein [Longilinea sp.]
MKAMRLLAPRPAESSPLVWSEVPLPQPGPGQVRLRVTDCGVCHTDLHIVEGELHPPALPLTPGHQIVGVVDALGEGSSHFVSIGQRLGVPWLFGACGFCDMCHRGQENLCTRALFTGFSVNGGFAEYVIANEDFCIPIPMGLEDVLAAPLLCAGIIGYRSLKQVGLQAGERLGLFGFGASAHLAIQVANAWQCETYVFTRSPAHRQFALQLGAKWVGTVEEKAPEPLDRAIIFAPTGSMVPVALSKLRVGGKVAINAVFMSDIPTFPYPLIYGERTLCSITNATRQD